MDEEIFVIPIGVIQRIRSKPAAVKRVHMYIALGFVLGAWTSSNQLLTIALILGAHEYLTYRMEVFLQVFSDIPHRIGGFIQKFSDREGNFRKQFNYDNWLISLQGMVSLFFIVGLNILIAAPMFMYGSHSAAYTEVAGFSIFLLVYIPSVILIGILILDVWRDEIDAPVLGPHTILAAIIGLLQIFSYIVVWYYYLFISGFLIQTISISPELVFGENPPEPLIYLSILSWLIAGLIIILPGIRKRWGIIRKF